MISDDERRNVAANIRSAAERRKHDLQDDSNYSPFTALYVVFCGVRGFPHYEDLLHLADLIDCPTCRDVCGRSRGDAAQEIGEVIGALRYHERHMTSVPPKIASHLAEHLERAVGEL